MDIEQARHDFGERMRRLRKEQKLSIRGFALMIGLSKDYIIDLEYGRKSPTIDTIVKVAWGLGMTPEELLKGIGVPEGMELPDADSETADERPKGLQKGYVRYHSSKI